MELRTHAHLIKNAQWFILLFTLLAGVAALLFAVFKPVSYNAAASFEVELVNRPAVTDYQYGAYYDLKAAELYTQHLMSLLMTPAVVKEIYQQAGVSYTIESFSVFTNRFHTKQYSAQNFIVNFSDHNADSANRLAKALGEVVVKHSEDTGSINQERVFYVKVLDPVVAENQINLWLLTVLGLVGGFLTSLILVYLREYFR
ncbi:MAG: hypothetical protein A2233_03185 [Candidatus Kerfeldbacteria bacterium RIFOXYA2_FULL_38_24]|uniref:Polysaccharide chain length determinant N-terminal domain-containing protein n=1 Tax=Candidatus Kerfeldbacteria bacterium RIFOXYB2_FULL_38_14 TaxID=1798547 RepID=A0A1G2BB85_9BACT|nr:MAG: hypothetical protein A2233_03185 [Candidatus Kerfeldbacteria bacterium RIFOXYA2_FULL_38_24]OGY86424.1 MAG: hypothetical protein A2319_01225 [Candidatus Kerfeldbacteria bacterium RIFOXYB2_FULL_38_14]OGY89072.1 MAG: hypothetical protein A2458_00675 [Candidatus Kerfeldbacteria bacterium RIFOXYC2_FULL_38_9]